MYKSKIAVTIPSYRVKKHILGVIDTIGPEVDNIYIIDDCCPEGTGDFVKENCRDERVKIIHNPKNLGVGGAVIQGYKEALRDGAEIIIKIDGDGQMNPSIIPKFIEPILKEQADYTKGNRFYDMTYIMRMPFFRLLGNLVLSFMSKASTGYWGVFDPTNGYTAIHSKILSKVPLHKISNRYFFETDMLFRLNTIRAKIIDIPMDAVYGDEKSNLKIHKVFFEFLFKHFKNFWKRIFYNYFLRDFSIASLELVLGIASFLFGLSFGIYNWVIYAQQSAPTPTGTIMLAVLPIIIGIQLLLGFISFDISNTPNQTQHNLF